MHYFQQLFTLFTVYNAIQCIRFLVPIALSGIVFHYCIIAQSLWFSCCVYNIFHATVKTKRFLENAYTLNKMHVVQVSDLSTEGKPFLNFAFTVLNLSKLAWHRTLQICYKLAPHITTWFLN